MLLVHVNVLPVPVLLIVLVVLLHMISMIKDNVFVHTEVTKKDVVVVLV